LGVPGFSPVLHESRPVRAIPADKLDQSLIKSAAWTLFLPPRQTLHEREHTFLGTGPGGERLWFPAWWRDLFILKSEHQMERP
jgi:hypothetical protein